MAGSATHKQSKSTWTIQSWKIFVTVYIYYIHLFSKFLLIITLGIFLNLHYLSCTLVVITGLYPYLLSYSAFSSRSVQYSLGNVWKYQKTPLNDNESERSLKQHWKWTRSILGCDPSSIRVSWKSIQLFLCDPADKPTTDTVENITSRAEIEILLRVEQLFVDTDA